LRKTGVGLTAETPRRRWRADITVIVRSFTFRCWPDRDVLASPAHLGIRRHVSPSDHTLGNSRMCWRRPER